MITSKLEIKNYCIPVSLGCLPEEHEKLQEVSFDVIIQFAKLPHDCHSDKLVDSYCYAKLTDLIHDVCQKKHFQLIEHLAYFVYQSIKKEMKTEDRLEVCVHKLKPPIESLEGGAVFCCGDE